jgi:[acyl-carrier-protein] S-malonyltransferase
MGKDLYENSPLAGIIRASKQNFRFRITNIMFEGTTEELKETSYSTSRVLHVILPKL